MTKKAMIHLMSQFCKRYDFVGAEYDGLDGQEITFFRLRKDNTLEPFGASELLACEQKDIWLDLQARFVGSKAASCGRIK